MKQIIRIIIFVLINILPIQIYAQSCREGDQEQQRNPTPTKDPNPSSSVITSVAMPIDPNEIIGVKGYDSLQWVKISDQLAYTIYFENDPEFATAAAQKVTVRYKFDAKADMTSFGLGSFGFGSFLFAVEDAPAVYQKRLDVGDSLGIYVDVVAGLDVIKKEAFWIFSSIDPETGLAPLEVHKGFLPVNDKEKHNGEGFVSFVMKAKEDCVTRDTISASASIVFDTNEAIPTNTWMNTIDAVAPISKLKSEIDEGDSKHYLLSFEAEDDKNGSGVKQVAVYISQNKEAYKEYAICAPDSILSFIVPNDAEFAFYSIATDNTGNEEPRKQEPDITINSNTAPTDIILSDSIFYDDIEVGGFIGEFSSVDTEENGTFVYALAEDEGAIHNDLFRVEGSQLQAASTFKCVKDSVYKIRISTTDVGGLSFSKPFTLKMKNVLVKPKPDTLAIQICEGDVYEFYGKEYDKTGYYVYSKSNEYACDSVYVLDLRVNPYPVKPTITIEGTHTLVSSVLNHNQWYDANGKIEGATERSFIPAETGYYHVITSNGTCESEPSDELYVNLSGETRLSWSLNKNWNWISINSAGVVNAKVFFEPVKNNFDRMMGYDKELINDPTYGLTGGLSSLTAVNSYKLSMKAGIELSYDGNVCPVETTPVQLHKGWNWIGYLPIVALDVPTALSGLQAGEGDVIKNLTDFSTYENGQWSGTLTTMRPGEGYMYKSGSVQSFNYSSVIATPYVESAKTMKSASSINYWDLNEHAYPHNMNVIARLYYNGQEAEIGIFTVGAFCGNECRGIGKYVDGLLYITIHGEEQGDKISFRAMENATKKELSIKECVTFGETVVGKRTQPFSLNAGNATDIRPSNISFTIYPNPVREKLFIGGDIQEMQDIQILNASGKSVLYTESYQAENGIDVSFLPDGAYIIAIQVDNGMLYRKFMKVAIK